MRAGIISFRYVEDKLLLPTAISGIFLIFSVKYSLMTLNWWVLAFVAAVLSGIVFIITFLSIYRKYSNKLHNIVGGKNRLLKYSLNVAFCAFCLIYFSAITTNRYFAPDKIRHVNANINNANKVVGPKLYGWDANIVIDGESFYQMVTSEHYSILSSNNNVILGLREGLWGLSFIISVQPQ